MPRDPGRCSVVLVGVLLVLAIALSPRNTHGDPAPPATSDPSHAAAPAPADDAKKKEAEAHFLRGLDFARGDGNWEAALAEFLASLELFPTLVATRNAAISLTHLGRYPEALEMYERLQRDFGSALQGDEKAAVEQAVNELRDRVGVIEIRSNENGATVIINGHPRGNTPLTEPLLVAPGTHRVRLEKEGFDPFEITVLVASRQTKAVSAKLRPSVKPAVPVVVPAAERKPEPAKARPQHFYVAGFGGLALGSSFGSGADAACDGSVTLPDGTTVDGCSERDRPLGVFAGARVGYELLPRLGVDLTLAYLGIGETLRRAVVAIGEADRRYPATDYEDRTGVSAVMAALGIGYRFLHTTPIETRLALGLARARISTENQATYHVTADVQATGGAPYDVDERVSIPELAENQWVPVVAPEVRMGYRLTTRLSVDVGAALIIPFPQSNLRTGARHFGQFEPGVREALLAEGSDRFRPGTITLPQERSIGTFVVFAPTAGVRLEL